MNDHRAIDHVLSNILREIHMPHLGRAHAIAETVLVGNIKDEAVVGNPGTKREAIVIIR